MDKVEKIIAGLAATGLAAIVGFVAHDNYVKEKTKETEAIAKETETRGFAAPSNIEFIARNVDFKPGKESIIRYKNDHYIVKLDENKVLRLEPYKIK